MKTASEWQELPSILVLLSRPLVNDSGEPLDRLDLETEIKQLKERLEEIGRAVEVRFEVAVVPENVLRILGHRSFDVLHFTGHGNLEVLAFENGRGGVYPLTAQQLKRAIAPNGQKAPFALAFLSACHSASLAPALLEVGVEHVVAIEATAEVLHKAAQVFARNFYPALFSGKSVDEAFQVGLTAVNTDGELRRLGLMLAEIAATEEEKHEYLFLAEGEELKFRLLPEDGDHRRPLFPSPPPEGSLTDITPPWPEARNLETRPETFVGRERELHALIAHVLDKRLVTVTGFGGIGKTELAREVGR